MTTKKENTKNEEIIEAKKNEIVEIVAEANNEELSKFLKNMNMDDEFIQNVLTNEELETAFTKTMNANQKPAKKTVRDYLDILKTKASEKKEVFKNAAIVVGITGTAVGVTYAICNIADEYEEEEEENDNIEVSTQIEESNEPYVEIVETTEGTLKITTELVSEED